MSKENLEQFMKEVAESDELKARISDEIDNDSLIALGSEQGYEFTAEDLNGSAELSDKELDKAAGGARSSNPGLSFRCWNKFPGRVHD